MWDRGKTGRKRRREEKLHAAVKHAAFQLIEEKGVFHRYWERAAVNPVPTSKESKWRVGEPSSECFLKP